MALGLLRNQFSAALKSTFPYWCEASQSLSASYESRPDFIPQMLLILFTEPLKVLSITRQCTFPDRFSKMLSERDDKVSEIRLRMLVQPILKPSEDRHERGVLGVISICGLKGMKARLHYGPW